jgi:hypothetical protein
MEKIPLGVDGPGFPDEGGGHRRPKVSLEPVGPALELVGGRTMRAQRGLDLEDHLVRHSRQLSCPLEVRRKL